MADHLLFCPLGTRRRFGIDWDLRRILTRVESYLACWEWIYDALVTFEQRAM
jgi:hypothetical protein